MFQRGRSYCLYYVGCWINVCVAHISSCITEVKIQYCGDIVAQHRTPKRQQRGAGQASHSSP